MLRITEDTQKACTSLKDVQVTSEGSACALNALTDVQFPFLIQKLN